MPRCNLWAINEEYIRRIPRIYVITPHSKFGESRKHKREPKGQLEGRIVVKRRPYIDSFDRPLYLSYR